MDRQHFPALAILDHFEPHRDKASVLAAVEPAAIAAKVQPHPHLDSFPAILSHRFDQLVELLIFGRRVLLHEIELLLGSAQ